MCISVISQVCHSDMAELFFCSVQTLISLSACVEPLKSHTVRVFENVISFIFPTKFTFCRGANSRGRQHRAFMSNGADKGCRKPADGAH